MKHLLLAFMLSATAAFAADDSAKARLAPLQDFVGEWKGAGQRERGKTDGAWAEKSAKLTPRPSKLAPSGNGSPSSRE